MRPTGRRTIEFDGVEYKPGRKFKVIRIGARLSGMRPRGGYYSGWGKQLEIGDIIICRGYGAGWGSDPGFGIAWEWEQEKGMVDITFYPSTGGAFAYRPEPGYLEPVDDDS